MWKIVAGIVVVGAIGGGVWWYMHGGLASMQMQEEGSRLMEGGTKTTDPNSFESGTWGSLMGMTSAGKCTVSTETNGVESMGTVYVADGNIRGDFSSTMGGRLVESHIIATTDTVYTWSTGLPQGVKTPRTPNTGGADAAKTSFNPNASLKYSCTSWITDASMFVPPATIQFIDVASMTQSGMPQMQ